MTTPETLTLICYFFVLSILAIYGWHRYYIVYQYMKHRDQVPGPPPEVIDEWPVVTIQLPIYNEMYVVDRLVDAVCAIDYPQDRLEIQLLDDSTDETCAIADLAVRRQVARGFDIKYRASRGPDGLQGRRARSRHGRGTWRVHCDFRRGLRAACGFSPPNRAVFLRPRIGSPSCKRAGAISISRIPCSRASRPILLDGHFVLEHGSRHRSGCFFNFNGTAGVWRRVAIQDAGGWQHDTLTEDLDFSYRAQLRGWTVPVPARSRGAGRSPVEMNAFKSQQHRWAKGSIQTCRKLLPYILLSDQPLKVKVEAFFHLTANFNYVLMIVLSLLMFPAMVVRYEMGWSEMLLIDVPLFAAATLSVFNFYLISQREVYPDWRSRAKYLPAVIAIGIGLAVNNAKAVLEALFGQPSEFTRTPKYGIERRQDEWTHKKYHQSMPIQPFIELALGSLFHGDRDLRGRQ